ncbi:MAG: preprotein translocase subunit SecG [Candidatus Thiodiazotropha endolucinida]
MQTILTVFHIFLAVGLVGLILIQHGKGADMGAAFGSGASGTVFGAKGSASFLTRTTALLATLDIITSMLMAYFESQRNEQVGVMAALDQAPAVLVEEVQQSDIPPVPVESDIPAIVPPAEEAKPAIEAVPPVEPVETTTSQTEGAATAEESKEQLKE